MKFYAKSTPQALPSWATVVSNKAGLIEVEINDEDPSFIQSLRNYLLKFNQELLV
jgi:DNA-directed RNA polymerase subunit L